MIPAFDENGNLPPGVYLATIEEIDARFGRESEIRKVQVESLRWLLDLAKRAGISRLVINGSFVTDVIEPNDVDCVLLIGPAFPKYPEAMADLEKGLPFLSLQVVRAKQFEFFVEVFFASDYQEVPKGMVEVAL